MATFLTADLHFGHANIIRFCSRPFSNVREMNEGLIRNWNETVTSDDDDVIVAGDFAMKIGHRETAEIFHALRGRKHLVIGNHDLDRRGELVQATARLPWASPPTHLREIRHDGVRIIVSHYAGLVWNASHRGSLLAFGHSHGGLAPVPGSVDVGVDAQGYAPVPAEEFVRQARATLADARRHAERAAAQIKARFR